METFENEDELNDSIVLFALFSKAIIGDLTFWLPFCYYFYLGPRLNLDALLLNLNFAPAIYIGKIRNSLFMICFIFLKRLDSRLTGILLIDLQEI